MPIRRAAAARSITPPSDDSRPPSKAAVIFLPPTAGKVKGSIVTSVMAGVACGDGVAGIGINNQILHDIIPLRYIRQPRKNSVVNKMG